MSTLVELSGRFLSFIYCFIFIFLSLFIWIPANAQNVGIGTTNPDEKLTVVGTIKSNSNSNSNFPQIHIHESQNDFGRLKYTNTSSSQYFMLSANPQMDSTLARFHINNSEFGNIGSFTGHGRFGINATNPAATLHLSSQPGTDLLRIQSGNSTKFRIFSNNAMVFGSNWLIPIPDVIRMETPNLFIGFDGNHVPQYRLEVDGHVKMSKLVMTQGAQQGKVLTSNVDGIGTWQNPPSDADADPTNEIQTLSRNMSTVTLSGGGGSFVDNVDDKDADPNNEIQTISKSLGTVTLSNGGGFYFDEVNDNDSDPNNEIQNLSLLGNSLSLSGGNSVKLSTIADPSSTEVVETNRTATFPQIALDIDATESFVFNRISGGSALAFLNSSNNIDIKTTKLNNSISGVENISIGSNPDQSDITGDGNIILGQHTDSEYSGNNNIMIGKYAGDQDANIRFNNIFIGESAGQFAEANSSICIGNNAGNHTGGLSIYIGDGTSGANGTNNRSVGIGYNTTTSASDQVRLGNSQTVTIGGSKPWTIYSDGRFKNNINENVPGLSFIKKLKPVTYTFDLRKLEKFIRGDKAFAGLSSEYKAGFQKREHTLNTGFIAQEVERAAQSLGYDFDGVVSPQNDRDPYVIAYSQFVVPLVKAVQELDEKNKILEEKNQSLGDELGLLRLEIEMIKRLIKEEK